MDFTRGKWTVFITLMIKSYIFKPAISAEDPFVIELIKTGPLPLTTIPCDPSSPGERLIDLGMEEIDNLIALVVCTISL